MLNLKTSFRRWTFTTCSANFINNANALILFLCYYIFFVYLLLMIGAICQILLIDKFWSKLIYNLRMAIVSNVNSHIDYVPFHEDVFTSVSVDFDTDSFALSREF